MIPGCRVLSGAIVSVLLLAGFGLQADDSGVHYSVDFITFANFAISKKADRLPACAKTENMPY